MRKDNDNRNLKRERFIMLTTSAMVLTVLTVTGAYVRNHNKNLMDDGYTIDFTALEDRADNKLKEIQRNSDLSQLAKKAEEGAKSMDAPLEAGSDEIKLPGITKDKGEPIKSLDESGSKSMSDGAELVKKETAKNTGKKADQVESTIVIERAPAETEIREEVLTQDQPLVITEVAAENPVVAEELHFSAESMVKPVDGEVIIPYSMEHGVYFATLDQYKCNPAIIYGAAEGEAVLACTAGRVINVHDDAVLGHMLVLDLGDGYQAIYGQLDQIEIPIGGMVEAGTKLASVATPTKYYGVEGSNLYFQILKDGKSVDPGQFFQE